MLGTTAGTVGYPNSDVIGDGVYTERLFMTKYDPNGNRLWIKSIAAYRTAIFNPKMFTTYWGANYIGGTTNINGINHIVFYYVNSLGYSYGPYVLPATVSEEFKGLDFDGSSYFYVLYETNGVDPRDAYDAGVKKLDFALRVVWDTHSNIIYEDRPTAITYNKVSNKVMVFGTSRNYYTFVEMYDPAAGSMQSFKDLVYPYSYVPTYYGPSFISDVAVLSTGEVVATGTIGFNGVLNNGWGTDILYAKFSSSGEWIDYAARGAYDRIDNGWAITVDRYNNYFIGGSIMGDLDGQHYNTTANGGQSNTSDFIVFKNRP